MVLGIDVGGTFTDAVLATAGRIVTAKAPTTPEDQSRGVLDATRRVLAAAGADPAQITSFAHGMTVATNALLEGRSARAALIVTEGFTDIVELGRQNRAELYRLCAAGPGPLIPPERRHAAPERMTPTGPLRPLTEEAALALADEIAASEVESVAVVLLHSYRHPDHERRLGRALRERAPHVSRHLSHESVGTFREYERAATTELDAALSPLLAGYLRRLAERCRDAGLPEPSIMQSNGGLVDLDDAAAHAALTVLSGPAGGAAGAAFAARAAGVQDVLCFDMGGTSCDVCAVDGGRVAEEGSGVLAGRPVALPMLAVHTVGAGGGSIAWRDPGGALRVGPRSAGADPGPACYRRGGTEPTVTDANVVLGYLGERALAGGVELDRDAAERAVARLAGTIGLDVRACAEGIRRVACAAMAGALRVVTVDRGVDPRRYALLAFGGAGPLHATDIATELGIDRVLVPSASGVLAALGLTIAPARRDAARSVFLTGAELTGAAVAAEVEALTATALDALGRADATIRVVYEIRYAGQSFELPIESDGPLRAAFDTVHEARYGYRDPDAEIELVTIRVSAIAPAPELTLTGAPDLPASVTGPVVLALPESTLLVPAGWSGAVDGSGMIDLRRSV